MVTGVMSNEGGVKEAESDKSSVLIGMSAKAAGGLDEAAHGRSGSLADAAGANKSRDAGGRTRSYYQYPDFRQISSIYCCCVSCIGWPSIVARPVRMSMTTWPTGNPVLLNFPLAFACP